MMSITARACWVLLEHANPVITKQILFYSVSAETLFLFQQGEVG